MTGTTITIAGSAVSLKEGTLNIRHRVDDKDTATFTIVDSTGTLAFSKGQTVSITDASLPNPNLFAGYINKPTATNLYPNSTNEWSMDCVSKFYVAAKKSTTTTKAKPKRGGKHVKQQSGAIVANQIQQYLAPDGVTGNFGLDWSELQTDWQTGTQSGVVAATNTSTGNVGCGDLELAPNGTPFTYNGAITFAGQAQNAIAFTGYASAGYNAPSTSWQIWTGSQLIATSDLFQYDVWISSTSPQIMAIADFVCSDGTTLSNQSILDNQGISNAATNDLSGLANDQWYGRTFNLSSLAGKTLVSVNVTLAGKNAGTYNAYFSVIQYTVALSSTIINIFGVASNLAANTRLASYGYTNVDLTQVTTVPTPVIQNAVTVGSITGPSLIGASEIFWSETVPNGCSIKVETSIDSQATWQIATSGSAIPNLLPGAQTSLLNLSVRATCTMSTDPTQLQIGLPSLALTIHPAYQATKSDINASYASQFANTNGGGPATPFNGAGTTFTNTQVDAVNGQLELTGFQRNWDAAVFSDQTLYGATSPAQSVNNNHFVLSSGAGADARSRMDPAGQWQNFTVECDIQVITAGTGNTGLVYRTTNWNNAGNTFAYAISWSTTQLQLGYGSNAGSSGTYTNLVTVSLNLAANSVHRLKAVISGNTHQIYLDSVLLINTTNATYPNAGYIGLRLVNLSGSTISTTFDNFGVCAALTGTWQSPAISISSPGTYGGSLIEWDTNGQPLSVVPDPTTAVTVQSSVDGGSTFQSVTNGGTIPNLSVGQSLAAKTLILKVTLTAQNATVSPQLWGISAYVLGRYNSSGTRSTAPLAWDSMTRSNVVGGFGVATNGATYTKTGTGTVALTSNEALISNTTGDLQMQIGSVSGTDEDSTDRFELSASTISAGIELRYINSTNFYRLSASTTALSIIRVSNGVSSTVATTAISLTTGTFYRMRFRVVGSSPATLSGKVWLDGTSEPAAFNVTGTDAALTYSATILADTPIGYYRLDDTNGTTVNDSSGHAHTGTINGGVTLSQVGLLTGDADTAITFNGTSGYVSLPTTGLPTGAGAFSLECWCRVSSLPTNTWNAMVGFGTRASSQQAVLYMNNTSSVYTFQMGFFGSMLVGSAFLANTTYHVCGTFDGTNARLYVNGALVAGPSPFTLNIALAYAQIGADGAVEFYPGTLDECAFYGVALSAAQVTNHYNAGYRLAFGGFALWGNGTGTASFDTWRTTQYPDPSVSLLSAGRAVNSLCNWNGVFPTNTNVAVSTSLDNGVTWQPHANPSDYIPTISTAAYYAAVRSNSPLAFYRLNEKTGLSAYDSSNNGNTATIAGGVTLGQVGGLQGVNEASDTAMLFDGTSGYVALPSAVTTNGLTALTLECWLNITALPTSANPRVLANSHTDSDFHGFQMAIAGTSVVTFPTGAQGTVGFDIGNGTTATQIESTSQLVAGSWTYVVVTWDGSNLRMYWNGTLQSTIAFAGPISSTAFPINIGRNPAYAGDYFPGTVQGVALYSTALSANAITAHYNAATQATQAVYSDSFTANTSAQYTQTFGTGGSGATSWTWDTANSRVVAVGGSRALLVYNTFTASDIDLLTDWYQSENGGIIWRYTNASNYYELVIKDSTNGNTFTLNKMSAGVLTTLSSASITFPVGTHHRAHVTMFGGVITAFLDENQILTYTDVSPLSAGQWGLRNDTGTSYCYLLQATPQAANISGSYLCVKQQLTTTDPTVTPQITDHQALVSDNTIGTGVTISNVDYRTTYVSDNIDDQNTQSNYWWNIGPAGVTFQPRNAANSPWILQSSDILIGTLPTVEYSGDLYRNQMVLKGVVQNSIFSQNFTGDGQSKTWNVANPVAGVPTILLNGQQQSVGIQGTDTGKAFYYQLGSTSITQDNSGTVLRKGLDVLGVAYLGSIGIDFSIDNTGQFSGTISQAQMAAMDGTTGIVSAIEDVSSKNMDVNAATTYANQLLQRYGSIARTLVCDTLHPGLQIGQSLPVFVPQLNIFDSVFLIVEIGITVRTVAGGPQYVYHLTCSESAALSSWVKTFSKLMRSVTGTKAKV